MGEWEDHRDSNGSPYQKRLVGYIEVAPGSVHHNASFPTASWYQDIEVEPGRYDVVETKSLGGGSNMVGVTLKGKIVEAFFPSSFAGNMIRDGQPQGKDHSSVGNISTASPRTYSFSVHADMKTLFGHPFTLTEMELERNHVRAVEERVLTSSLGGNSKDIKREYMSYGSSLNDMAFAGRQGNTVALRSSKGDIFVLVPENEATITGPFGEKRISDDWKHATVVRRADGTFYVNAGLEHAMENGLQEQTRASAPTERVITAAPGRDVFAGTPFQEPGRGGR